jgi:hypothetical protein
MGVPMNLEHGSILFNRTIDQCRSIGRRGGRARARNLRLRVPGVTSAAHAINEPSDETIHEANLLLSAQFPWLRGAERRTARRRAA